MSILARFRRTAYRVCLIFGPVLLAIALITAARTVLFEHRALRTTGTVVDLSSKTDPEQGSVSFAPIYSFTTNDGVSETVTADVFSNPSEFSVGEKVEVLYDPKSPSAARVVSFWQLWLLTFVFGLLGVIASTIGCLLLLYERRLKRQGLSATPV